MSYFIFKPGIFRNFTEPLMINNKLSYRTGGRQQVAMRHWDTCGSWLFDKTVKKLRRLTSWYLCWQKLIVCRDWSIWSTWWAWLRLSWASHSDYELLLSMVLRLRPRPLQKASPNPRQHGGACAIETLLAPARPEARINEIKLHSETLWSLRLSPLCWLATAGCWFMSQ